MSKTAFIAKQKTCFILAAGRGTRMLSLTKSIPKPLIKINKKPMVDYILDLLEFHGFKNLGINLFYRGKAIESHLKKANIEFVYEKYASGTGGGILAISKKIKPDSPFLVVSSDMMVNFDLTTIYKFHLMHGGMATICCYFRPKSKLVAKKSGQVLFDKKTKKVKQVYERSSEIRSQWVNSSVYIFDPKVLQILRQFKQQEIDIPTDLIPKLLSLNQNVFAYPVNYRKFYQLGIDSPERIKDAEADIKSGKFIPTVLLDFKT